MRKNVAMDRIQVDSSNVASVGYDHASSTLEIEFSGGAIYQYFDVPPSTYEGLVSAKSPGGFVHQQIRGIYRYART